MRKVAVITDSLACLTRELVAQYEIGVIPINFYVDGKLYRDWVDVTPTEAYELFLKDPKSFKSSAPPPEEVMDCYYESAKKADNIFCVTVSSKLSATYNVALSAVEKVKGRLPGVRIEVMDSYSATPAQGFIALAAARAAEKGKELGEVIKAARIVQNRVHCLILLDTMRHVYRSGRIPKIAAQAASVLNIRPIFSVTSGLVKFISAVRSRSHGVERIIGMMREKVQDNPVHVAVVHAYAMEEGQKLLERVSAEFNCVEIWLAEMSPLMGYACGTGTVGLAFYTEPENSLPPEQT